jgi:NDP-sugar pyrophosphorylase family protein
MKALLLCAGLGTRLRPLTETTPKPLLPISGKPLLLYHLESLYAHGVRHILINTHYLPTQIEAFVKKHADDFAGLIIETVYEENLLGSAGTLRHNVSFFEGSDDFFVVYGDNLTTINYTKLLETHKSTGGIATIASYVEPHPETKGIIVFDDNDQITTFIEKPTGDQIISHYANAGIYVIRDDIFTSLYEIEKQPLDFGYDVFPSLLAHKEKMYVYRMDEFLLDIGTLDSYTKAQAFLL